jgi:heptosyltransferase-3
MIRPGAIGDSLLVFPLLSALRRQCSKSGTHIIFASNAEVLPLALTSGLADEVSDFSDPQWSELFTASGVPNLSERYHLHSADLAICWLRDPSGLVARNLRDSGVKRVIVAPGRPPEGQRIHIVDYLAGTMGLDIGFHNTHVPDSDMPDTQEPDTQEPDTHKGCHYILDVAQRENVVTPLVGVRQPVAIHPGSGGARKCWPVERFVEVIKCLWQRQQPVLLLAGPADAKRLQAIKHLLPAPHTPDLFTILENAPLLEVAWQLGKCACYLGNDSGITHLAGLLGLPTIALFGPSDPAIWRPPGPCVEVIWEADLEQLPVEVVMPHLTPTRGVTTF